MKTIYGYKAAWDIGSVDSLETLRNALVTKGYDSSVLGSSYQNLVASSTSGSWAWNTDTKTYSFATSLNTELPASITEITDPTKRNGLLETYVLCNDAPTFQKYGDANWSSAAVFASQFQGNIPEPTSAMLMLVGLAGLMLKRKRA